MSAYAMIMLQLTVTMPRAAYTTHATADYDLSPMPTIRPKSADAIYQLITGRPFTAYAMLQLTTHRPKSPSAMLQLITLRPKL